jgi:mono/diheme cytochrome c family protein
MKGNYIMNTKSVFVWALGLVLLVPTQAESQEDPALVARGAEVYSTTCGRCHNVRSGAERTDREWIAIIAHMRARANMTKSDAAAVLAFLQATNAPEGRNAGGPTAAPESIVPNAVVPTPGGSRPNVPAPRRDRR